MSAQKIDGKAVAADVRASVAQAVSQLPGQPSLAVVLVGEDPASQVYVRNKISPDGRGGHGVGASPPAGHGQPV